MQLGFDCILADARASHERSINAYIRENRARYVKAMRRMKPNLRNEVDIYARVAFAILSANCPFDSSVRALKHAIEADFKPDAAVLAEFQCVPSKAEYVRSMRKKPARSFLRRRGEAWSAYRERLMRDTPGLGRCKASFAVSLLYPDRANVACLDTWMCKVIFGSDSFVTLRADEYVKGEAWVRKFAVKHDLPSTFLAQWAIWDHARDGELNEHDIFPGSHKDAAIMPF